MTYIIIIPFSLSGLFHYNLYLHLEKIATTTNVYVNDHEYE